MNCKSIFGADDYPHYVTTRQIQAGEELFVDYGRNYFAARPGIERVVLTEEARAHPFYKRQLYVVPYPGLTATERHHKQMVAPQLSAEMTEKIGAGGRKLVGSGFAKFLSQNRKGSVILWIGDPNVLEDTPWAFHSAMVRLYVKYGLVENWGYVYANHPEN